MKSFLQNISIFLIFIVFILITVFRITNNSFKIDFNKFKNTVFFNKIVGFENFIEDKNTINIVLGSSLIEEAIVPDSLGLKWYSFTNSGQNLDESIIFLDYYKDLIKIDTIIIEIQPYNFSILNNEQLNGYFYVFDFTKSSSRKIIKNYLQALQKLKDLSIPSINSFFERQKLKYERSISRQGFSGRQNKQIDIDSLFIASPNKFEYHLKYFKYLTKNPNYYHLEKLEELKRKSNIKVIYIIPPKSKYYLHNTSTVGNDKKWRKILDSLESRNIDIWDYESMNTDTSKFNWFWDETHLGYEGAKVFTKIIRERLKRK